jgi:broad specificity phosphatase PhoE
VRRLLLIRHAPTSATRSFRFPADEPIDDRGRAAAVTFGAALPQPRSAETVCSPLLRTRQTAEAAGLGGTRVVAELAECDFGTWAGRTLAEVSDADPDAVTAWITDPAASPHGGESLALFMARIGCWLDQQAELESEVLAMTHGGVIMACVVCALHAPIEAFWQIDVAPLSVTELGCHDGRWTVAQVNCLVT